MSALPRTALTQEIDPQEVTTLARHLAGDKRRLDWLALSDQFFLRNARFATFDGREKFWLAVQEAARIGIMSLPAERGKSWTGQGAMRRPAFVTLPGIEEETFIDGHYWHPDMLFANGEKPGQKRDLLLAIDHWIRTRRDTAISVPIKERSLEITGDEKRLDPWRSGAGFFQGALSLAKLKCHLAPLPIPIEVGPDPKGKPILVLENADTFHSFATWNQKTGRYSGIAYGAGGSDRGLAYADGYIDMFLARHEGQGIYYFGDIDCAGIRIPARASERRVDAGLPPLIPAIPYYVWLLRHGAQVPSLDSRSLGAEDINWIQPFADEISKIVESGKRIAQEWLGTTALQAGGF